MKRILIFIFTIISLLSFSQSEIWGVKKYAGVNNGGILYSIDSATNEIEIRHRFKNTHIRSGLGVQVYIDTTINKWIGFSGDMIYKYDPVFGTIETQFHRYNPKGSFCKASNGFLYILNNRGVLKVNPETLEIQLIETTVSYQLFGDTVAEHVLSSPSSHIAGGLVSLDSQNLIWAQYTDFYLANIPNGSLGYIYKLNIQNDSISEIIRINDFIFSEDFQPYGKLILYNNKYYGIAYRQRNSHRYYTIFTYDFNTGQINNEADLNPLSGWVNNPNGLLLAANGKFYSTCLFDSENGWAYSLFSFDPENKEVERLYTLPNNGRIIQNLLNVDDSLIYGICRENIHEGLYNVAFKYNILNNTFDSLLLVNEWNDEDYYPWEYPYVGPLSKFENKIISLLDVDNSYRPILSFDIPSANLDTIARILTYLPSHNGVLPNDFLQTDDGSILGVNSFRQNINKETEYYLDINVFNPISKEYKLKTKFKILNYYHFGGISLFNMSSDRVFVATAFSHVTQKACYFVYRPHANVVDTVVNVSDIEGFHWFQETDSTLLSYTLYHSDTGQIISRYNINKNQHLELYQFSGDTIPRRMFLMENKQLAIYTKSGSILKLNLNTNKVSHIVNTAVFSDEGNSVLLNDFFITEDDILYAVITVSSESRLIKYNIETESLKILKRYSYDEYEDDYNVFLRSKYIDDYQNNGDYYMVNHMDANNNSGSLKLIDNELDSLIDLNKFENRTYENEQSQYNSDPPLRKFKKIFINRWIGIESHKWYSFANWSLAEVPKDTSNVSIPGNVPFLPIIDTAVIIGNMVIDYDANMIITSKGRLTINNQLTNYGKLELQADSVDRASLLYANKMIQEGRQTYVYHLDSSIHKIMSNPLLSPLRNESPQHQMASFNANDSIWEPIMFYPFAPLAEEVYNYETPLNKLEFFGTFNDSTFTLSTPEMNYPNLYPLPNPYPSSINWNKANLSSLSHKALYRFNAVDTSFTSYLDGMGDASPLVQPLDVFWVYSDGNEQMQIDNTARLHAINFVEDDLANKDKLVLQVSGANNIDRTNIRFNKNASADFDKEYDAFKISSSKSLEIFTFGGEETLSINQLPDTALMDLFVKAKADGTYKISIPSHAGFDFVVLEDLIWNKRIDLLKEDYSFDYFASDGNYPFKLYFKPWALKPVEEADIDIYYYPESLIIRSRKQVDRAEITFYDLAGRAVYEFSEQNFFHINKPISLPVGHYIVQLRTGDLLINRKVLVR